MGVPKLKCYNIDVCRTLPPPKHNENKLGLSCAKLSLASSSYPGFPSMGKGWGWTPPHLTLVPPPMEACLPPPIRKILSPPPIKPLVPPL